jgi:hypothetical protein
VSLINYRAAAFWIGVAALSTSLIALARSGEPARLD